MFKSNKKDSNHKLIILVCFFTILLCLSWIGIPTLFVEKSNTCNDISFQKNNFKDLKVSNDIMISGNWSSLIAAGLCTGSGTYSDPYVIKDLILKGNGSGTGIQIGANKYDYFRIENCTISNFNIGIRLFNSNNGTLYKNNCSQNAVGIYMDGLLTPHPNPEIFKYMGCMNNTLLENVLNNNTNTGVYLSYWGDSNKFIGNIANNNHIGMWIEGSAFHKNMILENTINNNDVGLRMYGPPGNNSIISGNTLKQNKDYGIITNSFGFNLSYNIMTGAGVLFPEGSIEAMSLNYIDTTNTVNNGPIYYYINKTNLNPSDFLNAGQIILVNCSNSFIRDANLSYSSKGLSVCHSKNVKIVDCDSSHNQVGITLWNSSNSIIEGCTVNNNVYGIYIRSGSKNNTIGKCSINNNLWYGIFLDFFSDNHNILDSELVNNIIALTLRMSSFNTISGNIIQDNHYGIDIRGGSENNLFYKNFLRGNIDHTNGGSATNEWNNTQIGNYWDNYIGFDDDGDGIGEFPHIIIESPLILDYLPIVDKDSPEMIVYVPKMDETFGSAAPSFSISIKDKYLYKMWYTLDGGIHNYTFTHNSTINQEAWNKIPERLVLLRFYATDKAGNLVSKEISIYKNISGLNVFLIVILSTVIGAIALVSVGTLLLIRKRNRLKE